MAIQLTFSDPLKVSTETIWDVLLIEFKDPLLFYCEELTKNIKTEKMSYKIPKQRLNSASESSAAEAAETLEQFMKIIFLIALGFNLLLSTSGSGMQYMTGMMRCL